MNPTTLLPSNKQIKNVPQRNVQELDVAYTIKAVDRNCFRVTAVVKGIEYVGKITIPPNTTVTLPPNTKLNLTNFEERFPSIATLKLNKDGTASLDYILGRIRMWSVRDSTIRPLFALVRVYGTRKGLTLLNQAGCRQVGANGIYVTLAQRKPRKFCIQQLGGTPGSATVSIYESLPEDKKVSNSEKKGPVPILTLYPRPMSFKDENANGYVEIHPYQWFNITHTQSGPPCIILISAVDEGSSEIVGDNVKDSSDIA